MSLVTEVLTSAGGSEKQEVHGKVKILTDNIRDLQHTVYHRVTEKLIDFFPSLNSAGDLVDQINEFKSQMQTVSNEIETEIKGQLNISTGEFQSLTKELQEVNNILIVLDTLVQLQDALEDIAQSNKHQQFQKSADDLQIVHDILSRATLFGEYEIKIFQALNTEYKVQKEKLIFDVSDKWKEQIRWSSPETNSSFKDVIELKLCTEDDNFKVISNLTLAMDKLNILDAKIKLFGDRFVIDIVKNLLSSESTELKESSNSNEKILKLTSSGKSDGPVSYINFFRKFDIAIKFVASIFLKINVTRDKTEQSLMQLLGNHISHMVVEMIIKDCLSHAIPSKSEYLASFPKVVKATEKLQQDLVQLKFLNESNTDLMDYVGNVNVLFSKKKSQQILEKAHKLMTSDIHDTLEISKDITFHPLPPLFKDKSAATAPGTSVAELANEEKLSCDAFKLPKCRISSSINAIMNLAYEILSEATGNSTESAVQMYFAVRNIFELFCSVFPTFHRQSLSTLPQFTALHHNNCLYISHHLMTLGHQFKVKLPKTINATFVDLIPKIRGLGIESFMEQMNTQRDILIEFLQTANGFVEMSNEEKFSTAEKSIHQCLHQLTHLRNVWIDVLPSNIYRKAIGMLVNTIAVEIVDNITSLEDISSFDAEQLHSLINTLLERGETYFKIESDDANPQVELQRNVAKWNKLKELHLVLNASLQDISVRWADGKGPLAVAFTPNELKQLIRALFQNTDRRAAVLSKIK